MINTNNTIELDARKAISFDSKLKNTGGYALKHKPCCFGVALKWLINIRKMTYKQFGEKYDGSTGQNINHLINRTDKSRFFEEDVEQMCKVLKVKKDYFLELSRKIDDFMGE